MVRASFQSLWAALVAVLLSPYVCDALSAVSPDLAASGARLRQAFASPSGKLTYAPEIVVTEPTDPTAILLQSTSIQSLSSKLRAGKANAAFLEAASVSALRTFVQEQQSSLGNFPGPIPVIYCHPSDKPAADLELIQEVAEAGADGIVVPVCDGAVVEGPLALQTNAAWVTVCQQAKEYGVQPIPEITLAKAAEVEVADLVEQICQCLGVSPEASEAPAGVIVTMQTQETTAEEAEEDDAEPELRLPSVPKSLTKQVPVLVSWRTRAGEGRLAGAAQVSKGAGYTGAFLRRECLPNYQVHQLDLELVGRFWAGCLTELKSTKSKSFSFRAKNQMERNVATQWGNYQKSVIDSGALGDPNESYSVVDSDSGEYKGFA